MSQQLLTNYYKTGKSPSMDVDKKIKKHNLSLNKTITPIKRKAAPKYEESENVVVLSSDEEAENKSWLLNNPPKEHYQPPVECESDSSEKTIIYSPNTPPKKVSTPSSFPPNSPPKKVSTPSSCPPNTPPKKVSTPSSFHTPGSSSSSVKTSQSPSNKSKFFSPNRKRKVPVRSPNKSHRTLSQFVTNRRLFDSEEDAAYNKVCEGIDDKTKFLLNIIKDYLKQASLRQLLDDRSNAILSNFFSLPKPGLKLVCRLFWRKEGCWYRKDDLRKICAEEKGETLEVDTSEKMLDTLVDKGYLLTGTSSNIGFQEFTTILKADELKEICKNLKLKTQSKKSAVEALEEFSRRMSICSFFTLNNERVKSEVSSPGPEKKNSVTNSGRVLKIMSQKVGPCYRLSDLGRSTLERLYLLTYLGIDYEAIREKKLELMLINEKIKRETFPIDEGMKLDNAGVVFENVEEFERYLLAHRIYENFLSKGDCKEKCEIVQLVFQMYKNMNVEHLIRYKSLPIWLQRYTPAYIYIRILDEGLVELKKGKNSANCHLAAEILGVLIEQTFREHKKAEWFAEKALVLHSYLDMPLEAARLLIEGFESNISEIAKDCMRKRAKKIALQKNITLDENIRHTLLAFATKETIEEGNIPSKHLYKQPMDNPTKGKAMYETKGEHGRVMQGVEEYARSCYILNGEFTNGEHWEGRIVTTIYFLLFWDVIYTKPKNVSGIFLSHLQKYPLDMFCEEFYSNRKEAIDARLKHIEECSNDDVTVMAKAVWDQRPECELSGINRDIGWTNISEVCTCLGPRRVASVCRRLATNYHYCHSGFPDLTMWNVHNRQIKFVEVKSDSDHPSIKQIQWMQYLLQQGIPTEFCYVGANTDKPKSRQPVNKSPKRKKKEVQVKL